MHEETREPRAGEGPRLERAIVLQLLRDDHPPRWSREELTLEVEADGVDMDEALRDLEVEGVLCLSEQEVWASRAARRLDDLELLGI